MSSLPPPLPGQQPVTAMTTPQHTIVEVVAKRGGFGQALLFLLTLAIVATAFVVGIVFGAIAAIAPQSGQGLPLESTVRAGDDASRIAVVAVEGAINEAASEELERAVTHILADARFRAVVLRVDSPGGAVSPSDRMWRNVERLKAAGLPVVASYGGVAASGGVYVSCGADMIVCEPTAMTGSVGVIASVLTFGELMEKVGVKPETLVATGSPRKADANDVYRAWDSTDKSVVQGMLDHSYALFVDRVMAGRSSKVADPAKLREALDGRVVTADQAKELGLVDSIGYLDDAIAEAERRASLPASGAAVIRLFEPAPFFGGSLLGASADAPTPTVETRLRDAIRLFEQDRSAGRAVDSGTLRELLDDLTTPRLEYRLRF